MMRPATRSALSLVASGAAMHRVESYAAGAWHRPSGAGRRLRDAATGQAVAEFAPAGVDLAAAVEHGRAVGGPALRELTFHQRAAILPPAWARSSA